MNVATPLAAPRGVDDDAAPRRDLLWRFVDDVLLGTYFPEQEEVITRWTRSPTVTLVSPTGKEARLRNSRLFEDVIFEINGVLRNTGYRLRYIGMDKRAPDIAVMIFPRDYFRDFAEILGVSDKEYMAALERSLDYSSVYLNDNYSITSVAAVISADVPTSQLRTLMRYELLRALGFHKPSAACPPSIFYRPGGRPATVTRLAKIDRDVLRFLYSRLQPGDTWVRVWEAFQELKPKHYGCSP